MYSNLATDSAGILGTAVEVAICAVILVRRLARSWPSLLVYCASSLAVDVALQVLRHRYAPHFYVYWSWIGASALLRLWVLGDVLASFPGAGFIGFKPRIVMLSAAAVIAIGAWRLASLDLATHRAPLISAVTMIDSAVAYAWAAFLLTVLFAIKVSRLGWSVQGALVMGGISTKVGGSMITSYLIATASQPVRHGAMTAQCFCSLLAVSTWLAAVLMKDPYRRGMYADPIPPTLLPTLEKDGTACTNCS